MKIGALKETFPGEKRVALTPESAARLKKLGYDCAVEAGAGVGADISDDAYRAAGIEVLDGP
ncbi:MAG: NAD(P)(+) transhydrogenase (Re/Si-specific) subunit alpha, partial [Pseudomonadota bacterium]